MKKNIDKDFDFHSLPGHLIRRLNQIAVAIFLQETNAFGLTPVQYAALQTVVNDPGIDQRSVAASIGFDTSTIAGVIDRLEARGLLERRPSPTDRRVRMLSATVDGTALMRAILPAVLAAQLKILEPLSDQERMQFMQMLGKLVSANNEFSRAPAERPGMS
jgi:DNA-binding MarR family transcriptional regulator